MDFCELSKNLIVAENPLDVVFDALNEIWFKEIPKNINDFYVEKERETNSLEAYIRDIYFEIYDILAERCRKQTVEMLLDNTLTVLMDGFSIREANLLIPPLQEEGYQISDYSYTFSQIPSDTQTFTKQFFGVSSLSSLKQWKDFKIVFIASGEVPAFLEESGKTLIWISFPDELLHHAKGQVLTPEEAFAKTKTVLFKVLSELSFDNLTITSDHGYIYAKSASLLWKANPRDEAVLKRVFKGGRGILINEIPPNPPFSKGGRGDLEKLKALPKDKSYVAMDDKGCYVKGRFYWATGGKQSDIAHGGLSFMECMVPLIRLRR